ncbi:uncharacterized protein IWZ02DRAFT_456759 [Phyllosticta citriasiana]|uniref:uncharacterized protein n=1 Tax=Phyllosticta citriasiana TaxID=595635 RepID=UPI0030FD824F
MAGFGWCPRSFFFIFIFFLFVFFPSFIPNIHCLATTPSSLFRPLPHKTQGEGGFVDSVDCMDRTTLPPPPPPPPPLLPTDDIAGRTDGHVRFSGWIRFGSSCRFGWVMSSIMGRPGGQAGRQAGSE